MLLVRKLRVVPAVLGVLIAPVVAHGRTADERFVPAGRSADAPAGFIEMCVRDRALCKAGLPGLKGEIAAADPHAPCPVPAAAAPRPPCAAQEPAGRQFAGAPVVGAPVGETLYAASPVIGLPLRATGSRGTAALDITVRARRAPERPGGKLADTSDEARLVREINGQVNRRLVAVPDIVSRGVEEEWDRPGPGRAPADCEDYAIEKRMRLVEAGFPADRLFYAVVYRANFGLHTILVARLGNGDYVLDSAQHDIVRWSQTRYVWLRVQAPGDPLHWSRLG